MLQCNECGKETDSIHVFDKLVCDECKETALARNEKQLAWWLGADRKIIPSMEPEEIEFIKQLIGASNPNYVLEYGSGGSTVVFPEYDNELEFWVAVEHNKWWHERVSNAVLNKYNNPCIHIAYVPSSTGRWEETTETLEEDERIFKKYVNYPINREPFTYDLILIDGVSRLGCLANVYKVSKENTIVLLHDGEREWYNKGIGKLYDSGGYCYGSLFTENKELKVFGFQPLVESWYNNFIKDMPNYE